MYLFTFMYQNKNALWVLQINIGFNIRLVSTFKCILFLIATQKNKEFIYYF